MDTSIIRVKTKDKNVDADCKEFGRRLLVALDKNGMSQAELAGLMEVSRSAVNWWVQGNTYPSIDKAKRLAHILRTTPEYLIYGAVKVPKERLVGSIPVIDRVDGKQSLITRITLPNEFMSRHQMPSIDRLRAVTMFSDAPIDGIQKGDIVIADTSDKALSTKTPKLMVMDNGEKVSVGMATRKNDKVHITMDGVDFDMPLKEGLIVGRLVAAITGAPHITGALS